MKTKILLCLMALVALTATAQFQIKQESTLMDKLNPQHIKITEQVVSNKAAAPKPARIEQTTHQVNFVLNYDTNTQKATDLVLVNQDSYIKKNQLQLRQLTNGSNMASIPEGTYDIIFTFIEYQNVGTNFQDPHHWLYVIREQVTIDQDMQLNVSSAEAKNHIHIQTLTIGGEPINCGTYSMSENWGPLTLIEPGNTFDAIYMNMIACQDYGIVISRGGGNLGKTMMVGNSQNDYQNLADFYVNDVSNRYAFGSYRATIDWDCNNIYTSYNEVKCTSGEVTIANDPSKFKLYENKFATSQEREEDVYNAFTMCTFGEKKINYYIYWMLANYPVIEKAETIGCYISACADESAVGIVPYLVPSQYVEKTFVDEEEGYEYQVNKTIISTIPITNYNESIVLANSGIDVYNDWYLGPFYLEWNENEQIINEYPLWPSHPVFTYSVDQKKGVWGNNCPMLLTNPRQYEGSYNYEDENGNPVTESWMVNQFCYQYIGRYGEIIANNRENAEVSLKLNGESIYDGLGYIDYGDQEGYSIYLNELFDGVVDVSITNEEIKVDDMDGSNKAQLHYTARAEDETPPTMTMMHFRDNNGDVTDRFATAEDGTLEFSAADFNFFYTPDGDCSYFRQVPAVVEVSYAPYGTEDWNELPVEELPEYYWPAMGWFYRGSLAGVTGQAEKGWFDLKFRLEDAAGNWQEQVVSPAFRIDDLAYSSVATVTPDDGGDSAIYNLAGQRMRGDLNSLPRGIYIVGGKKVVIK